jgi:hypothetical protein
MARRFALALIVVAAFAGNARAAEAPVKAVVHPGSLSLAPAKDVTTRADRGKGLLRFLVQVTDARGNGRGWVLTARALEAARVVDVVVCCAPASTCTLPGGRPRMPLVVGPDAKPLLAAGIAQGIEDRAQLELLKAEHCDKGQGFLFAKPLSASALSALLAKQEEGRASQTRHARKIQPRPVEA